MSVNRRSKGVLSIQEIIVFPALLNMCIIPIANLVFWDNLDVSTQKKQFVSIANKTMFWMLINKTVLLLVVNNTLLLADVINAIDPSNSIKIISVLFRIVFISTNMAVLLVLMDIDSMMEQSVKNMTKIALLEIYIKIVLDV